MKATSLESTKTRVFKNIRGQWEGNTITTINGNTYEITTMKRYSGKISSIAQPCEASQSGGATIISITDMFQGQIKLIETAPTKPV